MGGQCLLSTSLAANVVLLTLLSLLLTHSLHNCREVLLSSPRSLSGPSVVLNAVVTPGSAEVANDATANEEQQKHEEVAIEDLRTREPRRRRDEKVIKEEDKYEAKPQKPLPAPPSVSSSSSSSVSSSSVSSSSSSQSEKVIGSQKRKEIMQDAAFDLQDDDYVEKSFAADFAAAFDHDNDDDDDDDDDEDGDGERATMPRRLLLPVPEENPSSEASLIPRLGRKKRRSSDGLGNVGARSMNAKIQPREAAVGSRGRKQQEQEQEQKYHEEEAEAATALDSANRDNANATIFLPVFLKVKWPVESFIASFDSYHMLFLLLRLLCSVVPQGGRHHDRLLPAGERVGRGDGRSASLLVLRPPPRSGRRGTKTSKEESEGTICLRVCGIVAIVAIVAIVGIVRRDWLPQRRKCLRAQHAAGVPGIRVGGISSMHALPPQHRRPRTPQRPLATVAVGTLLLGSVTHAISQSFT
jgi:hypothetical protein